MRVQRVFRPNRKTAEERTRQQGLREKLKEKKASQQALVDAAAADAKPTIVTGTYVDVQSVLLALKAERERAGLSVAEVVERSGLDRAVIARLENGKDNNPTVATLMRYAAAIGKRLVWAYEDLTSKAI